MAWPAMTSLVLVLLSLGQADARSLSHSEALSSVIQPQKVSPPLRDVGSDKKFFGPPFPADYPDDKRPAVDKGILNKLKGPDQPYPALQSKEDYDVDFVKDENSDKGDWQAQFEYDTLRRKMAQEEADLKRAQDRADREGLDLDGAQRDADEAAGRVSDAQKNAADTAKRDEPVKTADDFEGPPSDEKLKELKKAVKAAEERYEQQKKAFEECERQLEDARKDLEELKAQHKELEAQIASETKLWAEQKTVRLNLKKSKEDAKRKAAAEKTKSAQEKLDKAEKVKAQAEKVLAKQKAEHDKAQRHLQERQASLKKMQDKMEAAKVKLQKIHGYKPAQVAPAPTKSGARTNSILGFLCLAVAALM